MELHQIFQFERTRELAKVSFSLIPQVLLKVQGILLVAYTLAERPRGQMFLMMMILKGSFRSIGVTKWCRRGNWLRILVPAFSNLAILRQGLATQEYIDKNKKRAQIKTSKVSKLICSMPRHLWTFRSNLVLKNTQRKIIGSKEWIYWFMKRRNGWQKSKSSINK